jgi:hypothetical protein
VITGLTQTVVLAFPSRTWPRTRPASCGVKATESCCLTGVLGELFHVAVEVGNALGVPNTEPGPVFVKLATDEPLVPWCSINKLISSLFKLALLMISTVAVFDEPVV